MAGATTAEGSAAVAALEGVGTEGIGTEGIGTEGSFALAVYALVRAARSALAGVEAQQAAGQALLDAGPHARPAPAEIAGPGTPSGPPTRRPSAGATTTST